MPTLLDTIVRPIARDILRQFGASITYTRVVPGVYNEVDSSMAPTETTSTIKAQVEDFTLVDSGAGFASGLIEFGDKRVTVAGSEIAFEPTAGDRITFNSEVFTVVRIQKTYSGEQVALYELQARK